MQFAQPLWLLAGAITCAALVWQYRRFDRVQRAALAQFAAARLLGKLTASVSAPRRRWKRGLFTLGVALLFVALARPQAGFEWQETHRKGLELLFAVDTSKSMLAQDVKPDRLTRAKLGVTDLISKLNGDGVGLIAFAGNAFVQCPVTLDYDAFRESLDALDTNTIPRGGTDIAAAIHEAEAVFKTRSAAEKILVLITDGEDLGGEGIAAAEAAAKDGVKIFTIGVGSTTGELVPVPSERGGSEFAKDDNGQLVKSHLDAATLQKIAEATGGMYQPLGAQGEGLATIYEQGLAKFTREDLSSRQTKVPLEKFYWPLLGALACFVAELLIGNRGKQRMPAEAPVHVKAKRATVLRPAAALLALFAGGFSLHAATPQNAEQAYRKGQFTEAEKEYAAAATQRPATSELQFNTGAAAYKSGDFAQAANGFQQSLKTEQVPVQRDAYYNLGNTQYRLGQKTEKASPQETIKTWEQAVKSYDAALQIAAQDTDAKHNRDLVQRKVDQLKKQEEQKKQDQQKEEKPDQNKQDSKGDSKDQKPGEQGQQKDSKDQQGGSKADQDKASDGKGGSKAQQNADKDSKGEQQNKPEQSQNQQAAEKQPTAPDQKTNAQSGEEKKDQQQADAKGENGDQPKAVNAEQKPAQGKVEAAAEEQPNPADSAAAEEEKREPGQMTREEAKQLLDALKGDEQKVPAISAQGRAGQPNDNKILKDW